MASPDESEGDGVVVTDVMGEEHWATVCCDDDGKKKLDLSGIKLSEIPERVLQRIEVESLRLNTMHMTNIPRSLQRMTNITHLHLTNRSTVMSDPQGLVEFPFAVAELPNLTFLDLTGNINMTSFSSGICMSLKCLQTLRMRGCKVKLLPHDFSEMKQLQHLDVRGNPVDNLTVAVNGLTKLQHLALDGHRLTEFIEQAPLNISRNIHAIDISWTLTSKLPPQLTTLHSLDTLYVGTDDTRNVFPFFQHHFVHAADRGSHLLIPPREVLDGGQDSVDAYYSSLEKTSASRQKRGKMLLNGKSMAGKTSLGNAIEQVLRQQEGQKGEERERSCLTEVEDRTVSVEQRQLHVGDVDVRMVDTGGHEVYELTNQLVTSNNSLTLTVIDASRYETTHEQFHEHIGKYLHVMFDLLVRTVVLLVLTKIDACNEAEVRSIEEHITFRVDEFLRERKASRTMRISEQTEVHGKLILTSAKTLKGVEKLVECIGEIFQQPDFVPSVERILFVNAEDAVTLIADMLSPPIATLSEMSYAVSHATKALPIWDVCHILNYLHEVGSVFHFSRHSFLCDFVFPAPQFVVDLLKTLYRHDMQSLTLTAITKSKSQPQDDVHHRVTDTEFERMKRELTENGTVSIEFLRLVWSHFGFESQHYELLLTLLFKFYLAYPKCKDADTHRRITDTIANTMSSDQRQCYSKLQDKEEQPTVSENTLEWRRFITQLLQSEGDNFDFILEELLPTLCEDGMQLKDAVHHWLKMYRRPIANSCYSSPQLLSALEESGCQLLLPWYLPDCKPDSFPAMSSLSTDCIQVVSTYAFRYCVPLGLFDKLSARSSRHSFYIRHWKTGLYFSYGPVVAVYECVLVRPLPAISLTFRAAKSSKNEKRLCHVMWRCLDDMENLLQSMLGVAVNRYISREMLTDKAVLHVGAGQSVFCPVEDYPSFQVQPGVEGAAGVNSSVLSSLLEVANGRFAFLPLHEVFSARVGDVLTDEQIHAVARDLKETWADVAERLFLPDDAIEEVSMKHPPFTQPRCMLKKFRELMPESARVCVLCDALYDAELQAVADKHFNPDLYLDAILRPPPPSPSMSPSPSVQSLSSCEETSSEDENSNLGEDSSYDNNISHQYLAPIYSEYQQVDDHSGDQPAAEAQTVHVATASLGHRTKRPASGTLSQSTEDFKLFCPHGTTVSQQPRFQPEQQPLESNVRPHLFPIDRVGRHSHIIVLCPSEMELEAAIQVFQHHTNDEITLRHSDQGWYVKMCHHWNATPINMLFVSQSDVGEAACTARLTELSREGFSADIVVMTGACAGVENVAGGVEYGSVIVAKRTVAESGKQTVHSGFEAQGDPASVDIHLKTLISGEVEKVQQDFSWLDVIPHECRYPSPRYAQEIILSTLNESENRLTKSELWTELKLWTRLKGIACMDAKRWNCLTDEMLSPDDGRVSMNSGILTVTQKGQDYINCWFQFPNADEKRVVMGSMGSIRYVTENLPTEVESYRLRMADWKLSGIDMESHAFMNHAKSAFPRCIPITMKGVSNYGTAHSRHDYYRRTAAAASAAFLRHLLTQQHVYDGLSKIFDWPPHDMKNCSMSSLDKPNRMN